MADKIVECNNVMVDNLKALYDIEFCENICKDMDEGVKEAFSAIMSQSLDNVRRDVNDYHAKNDLYKRINFLHELIEKTPKPAENNENPIPVRFFDDTNRSLESLTFEHRRKMLEHVKKVDAGYDSLIQSYEQQLDEKYRGLMEELKKIVR